MIDALQPSAATQEEEEEEEGAGQHLEAHLGVIDAPRVRAAHCASSVRAGESGLRE